MKLHPHSYSTSGVSAVMTSRPMLAKLATVLVLILTVASPARAQNTTTGPLSDLTLSNLFTEGWSDAYAKRPNPGGAPDMALLRVQTNFLEREFRMDFLSEQGLNNAKNQTLNNLDALVAYGLNRRFMLSVTSNYEWLQSRTTGNADDSSGALAGRLQLIDIPGSSYALNFKLTSPAKNVGNDLSTASYSLAGWEDLTSYGLNRVGLYFDVLGDNYIGPHPIGSKSTDTSYDLSLAKTWTEPDAAYLQNFTTFGELFSTTDLSGATSGKTVVTFTPGIRTGIGHNQVLMFGVDLPVSNPRPYNWALRVTYIINF